MKKSKKLTLPPDPEGLNDDRAAWAGFAIATFKYVTWHRYQDVLPVLLCNLMHWCDRHSPDTLATHLAWARRRYAVQTKEKIHG